MIWPAKVFAELGGLDCVVIQRSPRFSGQAESSGMEEMPS